MTKDDRELIERLRAKRIDGDLRTDGHLGRERVPDPDCILAATRLEALQAQPVGEREAATSAAYLAIYGEGMDPLEHPEGWEYATTIADAVAAALTASPPVVERDAKPSHLSVIPVRGHPEKHAVFDAIMGDAIAVCPDEIAAQRVFDALTKADAILALTPVEGVGEAVADSVRDEWLGGDWYERWQDATENADDGLMATLESLRGRVERTILAALSTPVAQGDEVRGALKPFADLADWIDENRPAYSDPDHEVQIENWPYTLSCGWLQDARSALSAAQGSVREALEHAANEAYRVCAENRHVTLGDKVAATIRATLTKGARDAG